MADDQIAPQRQSGGILTAENGKRHTLFIYDPVDLQSLSAFGNGDLPAIRSVDEKEFLPGDDLIVFVEVVVPADEFGIGMVLIGQQSHPVAAADNVPGGK